MTAATRPLFIEQGATFTLGFTWRQTTEVGGVVTPGDPYDLTGCKARMQMRRSQGTPVLLTATSAVAGEGAGRIVLGGDTGRVDLTLTDEDTDLLTAKTCVYDLEIEWPAAAGELRPRVDRLIQGVVTVSPNITQVAGEDPVLT